MPRMTFAGSLLDGASSGLGRIAQAVANGRNTYQDAYDREMQLQSRMAQAAAAAQQAEASSLKSAEETRSLRLKNSVLEQLPGYAEEHAAISSGADVPSVRAFRDALRNGQTPTLPGVQLDGPNPDGSAGVPARMPEQMQTRIGQALQRSLPIILSEGKLTAGDWANAANAYRNMDLGDAVLNGTRTAADVGRAQAAEKGSDLFKTGPQGQVLDLFGGGVNVNNPVTQAEIKLTGAKTADAFAGADAHRAAAEASRAGKPNLQVVTNADGTTTIVDKTTAIARPVIGPDGKPAMAAGKTPEARQRIQDANDVLDLLQMATPLVDKATSSYIGQGADFTAQLFGKATPGSQAAAQLRVIEGMLISKMPKMSGPQSDKDVLLYRQMAGQIGDPSIPAAQKKAAMIAIANINRRYAGQQGTPTGAQPDANPGQPAPAGRQPVVVDY